MFKEVLSCVCFLVYVPFYLVKGPVGINKDKKMEHFGLEKHANFLCLSIFLTQSFSLTDGCNNIAKLRISSVHRA